VRRCGRQPDARPARRQCIRTKKAEIYAVDLAVAAVPGFSPMQNQPHRFPPPWDIEDNGGCSIVRDNNGAGARLMCILGDEPGRRATSKPLTRDEARRSRAPPARHIEPCDASTGALNAHRDVHRPPAISARVTATMSRTGAFCGDPCNGRHHYRSGHWVQREQTTATVVKFIDNN
jgi:hypothetical protein